MIRRQRRTPRPHAGLTAGERSYLLSGRLSLDIHGVAPFSRRGLDGDWQTDLAGAGAAWREHREELIGDAARHGLVPWGGRVFDGMAGDVSAFEHLRVVKREGDDAA